MAKYKIKRRKKRRRNRGDGLLYIGEKLKKKMNFGYEIKSYEAIVAVAKNASNYYGGDKMGVVVFL